MYIDIYTYCVCLCDCGVKCVCENTCVNACACACASACQCIGMYSNIFNMYTIYEYGYIIIINIYIIVIYMTTTCYILTYIYLNTHLNM